jgi:chloramphenicol-sensitive protein RarD
VSETPANGLHPDARAGFIAALSAYSLWGVLPLYLKFVGFAGPWEILAQRILWSLPAAGAAMLFTGGARETRDAVARPGVFFALCLSAIFIAGNWSIFVWAIANNHVIDASLAYFLTPLVNVAFGVVLFKERLTRLQGVAIALAAVGITAQALAVGAFPWIALSLCASWSAYGLVRKQAPVPAGGGLLVETMVLAPLAALGLWWLAGHGGLAFDDSPPRAVLLMLLGLATGIPLMLFAFGARRLRFSTLGMLQFIAPSFGFLIGVAYGEPVTPLRLAGFGLIWLGLAAFMWDALTRERGPVGG